jgi:hypothetical protein
MRTGSCKQGPGATNKDQEPRMRTRSREQGPGAANKDQEPRMRTGSCKRIPGWAWASRYQERQRRERPLPMATPTPTPTTTAGEGLGSILSPQVLFFCQIRSFYTANNYLYHTGPLPETRHRHVTTRLPPDNHEAPPKERGQQR